MIKSYPLRKRHIGSASGGLFFCEFIALKNGMIHIYFIIAGFLHKAEKVIACWGIYLLKTSSYIS
jgi:hypothetical protein